MTYLITDFSNFKAQPSHFAYFLIPRVWGCHPKAFHPKTCTLLLQRFTDYPYETKNDWYWNLATNSTICSFCHQPIGKRWHLPVHAANRSKVSNCHFNTSFSRFDTASPLVQDKLAVAPSYQATVAAMVILSTGRLIGSKLTIDLCYVRTVLVDFSSVNPNSTTAITIRTFFNSEEKTVLHKVAIAKHVGR